jgi:hypothetical protein
MSYTVEAFKIIKFLKNIDSLLLIDKMNLVFKLKDIVPFDK